MSVRDADSCPNFTCSITTELHQVCKDLYTHARRQTDNQIYHKQYLSREFCPKTSIYNCHNHSLIINNHWCFLRFEVVTDRMQPGYIGKWPAI